MDDSACSLHNMQALSQTPEHLHQVALAMCVICIASSPLYRLVQSYHYSLGQLLLEISSLQEDSNAASASSNDVPLRLATSASKFWDSMKTWLLKLIAA